jgi:phosphate transport system substrate-binding protein
MRRAPAASAALLLFAFGCGGGERAAGRATPAAGGAPSGREKPITIKGSDTMVILGQRFAEAYMKKNPGTVIQVTGGGSGTGIAALINGTTDLAQSSRPMKEKEKADVQARAGAPVVERPVAIDALAVFLHATNPVTELTLDQLKQIYQGKITSWKAFGGPDRRIIIYGRENSSGTYEYFKEHVLNKEDFSPRVQTLQGTAAVVNAVAKDPSGIGYGGIAYESAVKLAAIRKDTSTAGVTPSEQTAVDGSYPIARQLYFYYPDSAAAAVKAFVEWAISEEGQGVVENVGYFPLPKGRGPEAPRPPAEDTPPAIR